MKPNQKQLKELQYLDDHVWEKNIKSYNKEKNLIIHSGVSTRFGGTLKHYTKDDKSLNHKNIWFGGYFDGGGESSYDYYGRAIKSTQYTQNGFALKVNNLYVPKIYNW